MGMAETKQPRELSAETRMMKALSHPLRQRLLERLVARPASPSMLASELGEPLGNVSYHVKILLEYEAVELVKTRPVRGALEHIYRATARPFLDDAQWATLPPSVRQELLNHTLNLVWQDLVDAAKAGRFDDPKVHTSATKLDLDPQGFDQLTELLSQTVDRALEIQAESLARRTADGTSPDDAKHTQLVMLHFDRAETT
jgi:DNA-binding transcriptional ArsR family regulator